MHSIIRTNADVRALEAKALKDLVPAKNTFDAICLSATKNPDNVAFKFLKPSEIDGPPLELSYSEFVRKCYQTANMLHDLGLESNDVVSFLLPLCPQAYLTIVGGTAAGIVNAVNPLLEDWQIAKILSAANTKILVAPSPALSYEIWRKVESVAGQLPALSTILTVGGAEKGGKLKPFDELLNAYPQDHLLSNRQIEPHDTASYFHTGGTTGTPKLAQHTHLMQVTQMWSTGVVLGMTSSDVLAIGLPLFHIGGSIVSGLVPLSYGATLCVLSPAGYRDANVTRDIWSIVDKHRITILGAVPTVLGAMLNSDPGELDISSIRYALTGGAALPPEIGKALSVKLGKPILEGYGMTETTSYVTMAPRDGELLLGNVGFAMPHCEVKAVHLKNNGVIDRDCNPEEIGSIVIRGESVMSGYVQQQYNKGTILENGWLNSGDLGRFDTEGRLWLTGRSKDLIIRSGHNIDPSVIEEAFYKHPSVELAAAVGKPDPYAGEIPVIYVQLKPGFEIGHEELHVFTSDLIPERAAKPANIFILETLPLTAVGKIFKPALRWDAARRVFNELLSPIVASFGLALEIEVAANDTYGTLAEIFLSGTKKDLTVVDRIRDELSPFAINYEIKWI